MSYPHICRQADYADTALVTAKILCDSSIMDNEVGDWLRAAMAHAGVTQAELEQEFHGKPGVLSSLSQPVISRILNGRRELTAVEMIALADRLGVPQLSHVNTVPVVGYVGAGSEIHAIDDHEKGAGLEVVEVDFPVRRGTVAVIVRGDSMLPVFEDGDLIGYMEDAADPSALIGKTCVVRLTDGRTFIKRLKRGSDDGLFTLVSTNARDIDDVEIEWARRYRFRIPADEWHTMTK